MPAHRAGIFFILSASARGYAAEGLFKLGDPIRRIHCGRPRGAAVPNRSAFGGAKGAKRNRRFRSRGRGWAQRDADAAASAMETCGLSAAAQLGKGRPQKRALSVFAAVPWARRCAARLRAARCGPCAAAKRRKQHKKRPTASQKSCRSEAMKQRLK